MTIVSKFLDDAIDKCEELGYSKLTLSKSIVGTAVIAYVLRLTYPHIEKQIKYYKKKNRNKKNSLMNDDDDDDDDDDDEDEDNEGDDKEDDDLENGEFFTDDTADDDDDSDDDDSDEDDSDQEDGQDNNDNNNAINCDNILNDNNNNNVQKSSNGFQLKLKKKNKRRKSIKNRQHLHGNTTNEEQKHKKQSPRKTKTDVAEEVEKLLAAAKNEKSDHQRPNQNQLLIGLNLEFFHQLKSLLKIMIPSFVCHETGLLAVHTLCLISRTFLSIYVAAMEGAIVKFIVQKDIRRFAIMLLKWFGIAIPATFVNSMIRYLENKLALAFRTRLVHHSYKLYFKNQTYYRVSNLDVRIENADHRLTEDISTFSSSVAHLYSHLTKPCFDLMLIGLALMRTSRKMKANIFSGPLLGFTVISTTAHILRLVSPKFGQLVSEEANRYGYLRHIHSRIITNAEEIAFYGGHRVELLQLRQAYTRLHQQMNLIFSQKLWFIMLEQFFMKYVWSGTGMIMVSLPILASKSSEDDDSVVMVGKSDSSEIIPSSTSSNDDSAKTTTNVAVHVMETLTKDNFDVSERTQYLTTARNLLISGADAIERLMSSYKEIVALAGYTSRVAGMLKVFNETSNGIYYKNVVQQTQQQQQQQQNSTDELTLATTECNLVDNTAGILEFSNTGQPIAKGRIIYTVDYRISLKNVPVVTPNCDIVVQSLTLSIEPGMHLLITGPNGCGKSSLFRILSGLWPIYGGELFIPMPRKGKSCMFYIPQRPYLSIGSLREQIIYPDTIADMKRKKITENMLQDILKIVSLESIVARDKFDVVRDWKDILSGGEKQRMAIARLFYHKPKYALLDECTSAISIDVEHSIYEAAKAAGITLLTITHRPTLWKFHTHILEFDGQGSWNFHPIYPEKHINTNNNYSNNNNNNNQQ